MSALVALQSTILTKLHLAHIAFLRFLVRVNTHVDFQSIRMTKLHLAHITLVRFLVRVNTHVDFQITRCTKTFLAHITFVRPLVRVNTHVDFQTTRSSKTLLAHIALVLRPLSLRSFPNNTTISFFFSYQILLDIRNLQTQHQRWLLFFFFLSLLSATHDHRLHVYRSLRM